MVNQPHDLRRGCRAMIEWPDQAVSTSGFDSELNSTSGLAFSATVVGLFCGPGPMLVATLGLAITSISSEMAWSRTTASICPLVAGWTAAITSPVFGRLMDRYSPRPILILCTFLFGIGFVLAATLTTKTWHLFTIFILLGAVAGGLSPVGYNKILALWFIRKRGRALGLSAALGYGGGFAISPLVVNSMIMQGGWRFAYLGIGGFILLFCLPVLILFLRQPINYSDGCSCQVRGNLELSSRLKAMRNINFWLLIGVVLLAASAFYGTLVHMFPLLMDRGFSRTSAAAAVSTIAAGSIGGQLSAAVLLDRVTTPRVALLYFGAGLSGVALIHLASSLVWAVLGAILLGVGQGAELVD